MKTIIFLIYFLVNAPFAMASTLDSTCAKEHLGKLSFYQLPYLVYPTEKDKKVSLSQKPGGTGEAYLISGDLVQLAQEKSEVYQKDGFACAFYENAKGKITIGWISVGDLKKIPDEEPVEMDQWFSALPEMKWFLKTSHIINYPGVYANKEKFSLITDDKLQVKTNRLVEELADQSTYTMKKINSRVQRFVELLKINRPLL